MVQNNEKIRERAKKELGLVVDDEITFPVSTFNRMIRYIGYGYQPCRETKLKIVTELARLDVDNQKDFQEQLGKSLYEGFD